MRPSFSCGKNFFFICLFSLLCTQVILASPPQNSPTGVHQYSEEETKAIYKAAEKAATEGPATVALLKQASLKLPKNFIFIPKEQAAPIMSSMGNSTSESFVGLIFSTTKDFNGFITINYLDSGHINDEDAKDWSADDLFKTIKEGNDEANKERAANGFPSLEVVDWIEKPNYDAKTHKLIWSLLGKEKDNDKSNVVNYNTYILGRQGYFKLNLITSKEDVQNEKLISNDILASFNFDKGNRYDDFTANTDRLAAYGIAALVTGVAAKKLGLIALAGVFIIKMWKLLILLPVILWGTFKKVFKRS